MGERLNIVTPLHEATTRDYLARMLDEKVACMDVAQAYGREYWDGDRRFGYGGYRYIPGRWTPVAEALVDRYGLTKASSVLDVGCGKAFLLHEMKRLIPELNIVGFDVSAHGIDDAKADVRDSLFIHRAQDKYPFHDDAFDLVISLGCLHNLRLPELQGAVSEIQRVGRKGYLMVESYRNNAELFNLQCWALTAQSFLDAEEWQWLYHELGYSGDYEFIFFN